MELPRASVRLFDETRSLICSIEFGAKRAKIPSYAPNEKLRKFEKHRPYLADSDPHIEYLSELGEGGDQATDDRAQIHERTEERVFANMMINRHDFESYQSVIDRLPTWRFATVGPGLDIWYGNGLRRTHKLGRVDDTRQEDLLEKPLGHYPNYALGGFFEIERMPSPTEVADAAADPAGQRVYMDGDELQVKW